MTGGVGVPEGTCADGHWVSDTTNESLATTTNLTMYYMLANGT